MQFKSLSDKMQETPTRWTSADVQAIRRNETKWRFCLCPPCCAPITTRRFKKGWWYPTFFWGWPWRRTRCRWTVWLWHGTEVTAGREVVEPRASTALSPGCPGRCPRCWSPTAYPRRGGSGSAREALWSTAAPCPLYARGPRLWVQGSRSYLLMITNDFIIYSLCVLYRDVMRSNQCIVFTYCDRRRCHLLFWNIVYICFFSF